MKLLQLIAPFIIAICPMAHAASHTWSGAGGDRKWSNPANWLLGGAPGSAETDATLLFPANASTKQPIDDVVGLIISQLQITGGGYIFSGSNAATLTFSGAPGDNFLVTNGNNGGGTQISSSLPIVLNATSRFTTDGSMLIDTVIKGAGGFTTNGNITFYGNGANTYTGPTTIQTGTLYLSKSDGLNSFAGSLTVTGSGIAHTYADEQIPDTSVITLSAGGTLNIDNTLEKIGPLSFAQGSILITNSRGLLTLGADLTVISGLGNNTILGKLTPGGTTRTLNISTGSDLKISATISDLTAGLIKSGGGNLILDSANTYTGDTVINDGKVSINSPQSGPCTVGPGGTLTGIGGIGHVALSGKMLLNNIKTKNLTATAATAQVLTTLSSSTIYGHLKVTGTVDLTAATFIPTLAYIPAPGTNFLLIENDDSDPITGTFTSLLEGASITLGGQPFTISYIGGTGNDVVLHYAGSGQLPLAISQFTSTANTTTHPGTMDHHIVCTGPPGVPIQLQSSPDLITWIPVSSASTDVLGQLTFDVNSGSAPRMFYRSLKPGS